MGTTIKNDVSPKEVANEQMHDEAMHRASRNPEKLDYAGRERLEQNGFISKLQREQVLFPNEGMKGYVGNAAAVAEYQARLKTWANEEMKRPDSLIPRNAPELKVDGKNGEVTQWYTQVFRHAHGIHPEPGADSRIATPATIDAAMRYPADQKGYGQYQNKQELQVQNKPELQKKAVEETAKTRESTKANQTKFNIALGTAKELVDTDINVIPEEYRERVKAFSQLDRMNDNGTMTGEDREKLKVFQELAGVSPQTGTFGPRTRMALDGVIQDFATKRLDREHELESQEGPPAPDQTPPAGPAAGVKPTPDNFPPVEQTKLLFNRAIESSRFIKEAVGQLKHQANETQTTPPYELKYNRKIVENFARLEPLKVDGSTMSGNDVEAIGALNRILGRDVNRTDEQARISLNQIVERLEADRAVWESRLGITPADPAPQPEPRARQWRDRPPALRQ